MRNLSQKFAAVLLVALCLLGNRFALASDWVSVGGNVQFGEIPVCALVLINGQTQFSCDGTGRYDMQVPVDDNGMITVMAFADGFAPFSQIVTPDQAAEYPIEILLDQNSPTYQVVTTYEPSATEGRFVVSGTIYAGTLAVCALVLANGQNMFSCNENSGQFSLDVPLDEDGNVTLMVFADGFKPYKLITNVVLDSDQDGIKDYLDYDDDNDGIFDVDDACPLDPNLECSSTIRAADTINVRGRVWAQPDLFLNLSWYTINAVCPGGVCGDDAILNGWNMSGWTWASQADLCELFNFYLSISDLDVGTCPEIFYYSVTDPMTEVFDAMFGRDGWRPTSQPDGWREIAGWYFAEPQPYGPYDLCKYAAANELGSFPFAPSFRNIQWAYCDLHDSPKARFGFWFYK